MNTITATRVDAPKGAGLQIHDCAICGHEELAHPVWLRDNATGHVFPAGTGCAAKALGRSIADLEADIAAERLAAAPDQVRRAYGWFALCLPGRVTPAFIKDAAARSCGGGMAAGEAAADIYRALKRAGRARSAFYKDARGA